MSNELIECLRRSFEQHVNENNARAMSVYMREQFIFYGIRTPERRQLQNQCLQAIQSLAYSDLIMMIQCSYQESQREWHYFAGDLADKYHQPLPAEFIQTAEFMITRHSWWDTVDNIASKTVGHLVQRYPELVTVMDQWIAADNIWLRRSAILHQLKYKQHTDVTKLLNYCEQAADSKEFFIQKAIGWVLREYSKTDALTVKQFVATHNLSHLSRTEALKWVSRPCE